MTIAVELVSPVTALPHNLSFMSY